MQLFESLKFYSDDGLEMAVIYSEDGHEIIINWWQCGRDCTFIIQVC